MIYVADFAAVFDRPVPGLVHPKIQTIERQRTLKTTSPAAAYALTAARRLAVPEHAGLFVVCGPTGSTCEAFDGAWRRSTDGRLTGSDFSQSRYKRIHPLTLITSLQNQLAAVLSIELGLGGPCLNAVESPSALYHGRTNIEALLATQGSVLIVLAAAGDRDEERLKQELEWPGSRALEGAICTLATAERRGRPLPVSRPEQDASFLDQGLDLLRHLI